VGSRSNHLQENIDINNAVYTPGSTLGTDSRRRFKNYSDIYMGSEDANSSYHSFQAGLSKRFVGTGTALDGLTLLANYTFSKNLTSLPRNAGITTFGPGYATQTLPYDTPGRAWFDYGPADFDRTHRIVISYVWETPAPQSFSKALRAVVGHWQLSGIFTAQTGDPLTILAGADQSKTGLNNDRAYYLGGETVRLQFRMEFFNVFNHANLNDPVVSLNGAGFGSILSASDPRIGQAALKLYF
jgi:hypothetical protein